MADRPYVSHLTRELERIFEANLNNKKILTELKKELSFRSRPKALKLKEKVECRLAELKQGKYVIEQASLLDSTPPHPTVTQGTLLDLSEYERTRQNDSLPPHDEVKKMPCRQRSFFEKLVQQCKKLFGE